MKIGEVELVESRYQKKEPKKKSVVEKGVGMEESSRENYEAVKPYQRVS